MKKAITSLKKDQSAPKEGKGEDSPPAAARLIDVRIKELNDWRGDMLARVRKLIRQADPEVVEEWKWRGVPVWSHGGIVCTGETYKEVVKVTFAKGAALADPSGLFNASLEGNTRRAIDFREGDAIDEKALKALVRAAVALNTSGRAGARPRPLSEAGRKVGNRDAGLLGSAQAGEAPQAPAPHAGEVREAIPVELWDGTG